MKILHFYKTYVLDSYGGIEQFIFQLAHGSAEQGVDVEVLSLSPSVRYETVRLTNHVAHRVRRDIELASTSMSVAALKKFSDLARHADIIHLHYPWPFGDLTHLLSPVSRPTVLTYHSDIVRQKVLAKLYKPLMSHFLRTVDRIVATSPNYLATSETLRPYRHKTTVIPIGLNRSTYPPVDQGRLDRWRKKLGERFLLFVGVLRYYKGLHILLEALRGIDVATVIVGAGPIEAELRSRAQRIGLTNVQFMGAVSEQDKVALFELSYAIVFPSHLRSEAFGISLLEGAMFGKPMISSEIGTGTSFINIHGETGLVVPPNDPHAFREALIFMCDHPELAREMGCNARSRFEQNFTAEKMVGQYLALYDDLLLNARRAARAGTNLRPALPRQGRAV